jgi:hypothetical protein
MSAVTEFTNVRPPLFRFELLAVEDRAESVRLANGSVSMKDEAWVFVQQLGSRDEAQFPAEQWITQMELESRLRPKQMPPRWVQMFKDAYKDFKAGNAMQVNGTSIRSASFLTPAEIANLIRIGVQAIEDAAALNDEGLRRYGMGGLQVKQKCADWLTTRDSNKTALEMNQLREQNEALKGQMASQQETLDAMQAQLAVLNAGAKAQGKRT